MNFDLKSPVIPEVSGKAAQRAVRTGVIPRNSGGLWITSAATPFLANFSQMCVTY